MITGKLGKLPPKDDPRTLQLRHYMAPLPAPPRDIRWGKPLPARGLGMMGNDTLGDCTCAAAGHMEMVWTANAGVEKQPTTAEVEAMYWATGSADDGRMCIDVLNYWRNTGLAGDKIVGYAEVNVADPVQVQTALWLFGGLYIGVQLPVTAQQQKKWAVVGDGQTGDSAPGSWGGHAIPVIAAIPGWGYTAITWGQKIGMTWRFWITYVDECYAVLSTDWLEKSGKSIQGFDLAQLKTDLSAV